jgi:hypothetical protein
MQLVVHPRWIVREPDDPSGVQPLNPTTVLRQVHNEGELLLLVGLRLPSASLKPYFK